MPVFRYFVGVGSVLLALLLLADRWLPKPVEIGSSHDAHPEIRITTAHKWPERVVFDTSSTSVAPISAAPAAAEPRPPAANDTADTSPATSGPLEARAQLLPAVAAKPAPRRKVTTASTRRAISHSVGEPWRWPPSPRQARSWSRRFASYGPW